MLIINCAYVSELIEQSDTITETATSLMTLQIALIQHLPFLYLEGQRHQDIEEEGMPSAQEDIIILVLRIGLVLVLPVSVCL